MANTVGNHRSLGSSCYRVGNNTAKHDEAWSRIKNKKLEVVENRDKNNNSAYFQIPSQNHTISNHGKILLTVHDFNQYLCPKQHHSGTITTFIENLALTDFLDLVFYMCYSKNDESLEITKLLYKSLEDNASEFNQPGQIKLEQICLAIKSMEKRLSSISIDKINSVYAKQEHMQNNFISLLKQVHVVATNMKALLNTCTNDVTRTQIDDLMYHITEYHSMKKDGGITESTQRKTAAESLIEWGLAGDLDESKASSLEIDDDQTFHIFDINGFRFAASIIEAFNEGNTSFVPKQIVKLYKKYLQLLLARHEALGGTVYNCEEKLIQNICSSKVDKVSNMVTSNWHKLNWVNRPEKNNLTSIIIKALKANPNAVFEFSNIVQIKTVFKDLLDARDFNTLRKVIGWISASTNTKLAKLAVEAVFEQDRRGMLGKLLHIKQTNPNPAHEEITRCINDMLELTNTYSDQYKMLKDCSYDSLLKWLNDYSVSNKSSFINDWQCLLFAIHNNPHLSSSHKNSIYVYLEEQLKAKTNGKFGDIRRKRKTRANMVFHKFIGTPLDSEDINALKSAFAENGSSYSAITGTLEINALVDFGGTWNELDKYGNTTTFRSIQQTLKEFRQEYIIKDNLEAAPSFRQMQACIDLAIDSPSQCIAYLNKVLTTEANYTKLNVIYFALTTPYKNKILIVELFNKMDINSQTHLMEFWTKIVTKLQDNDEQPRYSNWELDNFYNHMGQSKIQTATDGLIQFHRTLAIINADKDNERKTIKMTYFSNVILRLCNNDNKQSNSWNKLRKVCRTNTALRKTIWIGMVSLFSCASLLLIKASFGSVLLLLGLQSMNSIFKNILHSFAKTFDYTKTKEYHHAEQVLQKLNSQQEQVAIIDYKQTVHPHITQIAEYGNTSAKDNMVLSQNELNRANAQVNLLWKDSVTNKQPDKLSLLNINETNDSELYFKDIDTKNLDIINGYKHDIKLTVELKFELDKILKAMEQQSVDKYLASQAILRFSKIIYKSELNPQIKTEILTMFIAYCKAEKLPLANKLLTHRDFVSQQSFFKKEIIYGLFSGIPFLEHIALPTDSIKSMVEYAPAYISVEIAEETAFTKLRAVLGTKRPTTTKSFDTTMQYLQVILCLLNEQIRAKEQHQQMFTKLTPELEKAVEQRREMRSAKKQHQQMLTKLTPELENAVRQKEKVVQQKQIEKTRAKYKQLDENLQKIIKDSNLRHFKQELSKVLEKRKIIQYI